MRNWQDKIIVSTSTWIKPLGCRVILTNGCFDILHVGHLNLLMRARATGDALSDMPAVLVVAVNSDKSVRTLKGPTRPINNENDRVALIAALEPVDYVLTFNDTRCTDVIEKIAPDVWVKGGDYTLETLDAGERSVAERVGAKIKILPLIHGYSTTNTIARSKT
jgi:rfaE bifunctional protein nucleotidyltransferase chain/domain